MSITSNKRKENTNSYADQQIHGPMGKAPELAQLDDRDLTNELASKKLEAAEQPSAVENLEDARQLIAETDDANQPQAATDSNKSVMSQASAAKPVHVEDADWNRSTQE